MNTLDTAKSILDELGATYTTENLDNYGFIAGWIAYEVSTGSGNTIRIYSNDVEASLTLAEQTPNGVATGEQITLVHADRRLTELTIKMLLELHA